MNPFAKVTFEPGKRRTDFEESALLTLISALQSRGRTASDIGCPELDPSDRLNTDARFEIDGAAWAVEHCRIVHDPGMIAAHAFADKSLRTFGNDIASKHGVRISVAFYPPRWQRGEGRPNAFYSRIKGRIEASAQSRINDRDSDCQIYVNAEQPEFEMSFFTANDALIRNQLLSGLKRPLLKKHAKQFMTVQSEGLPLLLLLDQMDDPESKMGSQRLFSIETLRDVLIELFPEANPPVTEVWLRRPDGDCISVIPADTRPVADGLAYLWH